MKIATRAAAARGTLADGRPGGARAKATRPAAVSGQPDLPENQKTGKRRVAKDGNLAVLRVRTLMVILQPIEKSVGSNILVKKRARRNLPTPSEYSVAAGDVEVRNGDTDAF